MKYKDIVKLAGYRHGMDVDKVRSLRDKKKSGVQLTNDEQQYLKDYNNAKEQDAFVTPSVNALGAAGLLAGYGMRNADSTGKLSNSVMGGSVGALSGYHLARALGGGTDAKVAAAVALAILGAGAARELDAVGARP